MTIHPEAEPNLKESIGLIKSLGVKAGVAINPDTDVSVLKPVIKDLDLALVMTVYPGFGGQSFIDSQLEKIKQIREMIEQAGLTLGTDIDLEVDGGINPQTADLCRMAGANVLVAGTSVFSHKRQDYGKVIARLRGPG